MAHIVFNYLLKSECSVYLALGRYSMNERGTNLKVKIINNQVNSAFLPYLNTAF